MFDLYKSRVYCDMDEVLVDFLGGARRELGKDFNDPDLGSMESRWEIISRNSTFWLDLEWLPEAKTLWNWIRPMHPFILSACPKDGFAPTCSAQKMEWCRMHLDVPSDRVHIVRREEKHLFAQDEGVSNILIDDYKKNLDDWKAAGGITILHTSVSETIAALNQLV